jgi:hypothetical protein
MPSPAHRATVLVRAEKQLRFDQPRPEEPPGGHTDLPISCPGFLYSGSGPVAARSGIMR